MSHAPHLAMLLPLEALVNHVSALPPHHREEWLGHLEALRQILAHPRWVIEEAEGEHFLFDTATPGLFGSPRLLLGAGSREDCEAARQALIEAEAQL